MSARDEAVEVVVSAVFGVLGDEECDEVLAERIGRLAMERLDAAGFLATDEERIQCRASHPASAPCQPAVRRVTPWRSA